MAGTSPAMTEFSRRRTARRRDLPAHRRRAPRRGRRLLADPGDGGAAGARARQLGRPYVSLLGSREHTFFTDGARELFDCAGQGRVDVFFLSGGQIDGEGNINLVSIGDYDSRRCVFPARSVPPTSITSCRR